MEEILPEQLNASVISALTERNRSWEWNYGQKLPFSFEWEHRFPWGGLQVQLQIESGIIRQSKVYSDAMDWQLAANLESALTGCRFTAESLSDSLRQSDISAGISEALLESIR